MLSVPDQKDVQTAAPVTADFKLYARTRDEGAFCWVCNNMQFPLAFGKECTVAQIGSWGPPVSKEALDFRGIKPRA